MFLRMFVCVFFPVLCCFVPSLYDSLFKYEMLFSDKERMDGNTTKGKFVHLVHYFWPFFPPLDGVNKQAQVQAATAEFTGSTYKFSSHEYRNNS